MTRLNIATITACFEDCPVMSVRSTTAGSAPAPAHWFKKTPPSERRSRYWAVTLAVGKSILPLPPPASTRTLASYIFPIVMPMPFHASKCLVSEM